MKQLLTILGYLLIVCAFSACGIPETYTYVQVNLESNSFGNKDVEEGEHKEFKAYTDSSAFLEAYQNFVIAKKVHRDMKEVYGTTFTEPTAFRLLNKNGDDISSSVFFEGMDSMKRNIESRIDTMPNTLRANADRAAQDRRQEDKKSLLVDSLRVAQLIPSFHVKKDEFDPKGRTWYEPRGKPKLRSNGIYFYFQAIDDVPSNFRLVVHYSDDEWLFLQKVQFSIDGEAFEFIPSDTERDNGAGIIWEWFDESVRYSSEVELVEALANAKSAKMKLIGSQYHQIKRISGSEIARMKKTLELYRAMGGEL